MLLTTLEGGKPFSSPAFHQQKFSFRQGMVTRNDVMMIYNGCCRRGKRHHNQGNCVSHLLRQKR